MTEFITTIAIYIAIYIGIVGLGFCLGIGVIWLALMVDRLFNG